MAEKKTKLKPCPFCGGKAKLYGDPNIVCKTCGCMTNTMISKEAVIKTWNNRDVSRSGKKGLDSWIVNTVESMIKGLEGVVVPNLKLIIKKIKLEKGE